MAHASLEHYYLIPHEAYDWIKTIYLNVQKQELQVGFLEHVNCRNRKDRLVEMHPNLHWRQDQGQLPGTLVCVCAQL